LYETRKPKNYSRGVKEKRKNNDEMHGRQFFFLKSDPIRVKMSKISDAKKRRKQTFCCG